MIGIQLKDYEPNIQVRRSAETGKITSGLVIGDILQQNQALILLLHRGELKEKPHVGVGITDILLDHDLQLWKTIIREQLEMDGQKVEHILISKDSISIDAKY